MALGDFRNIFEDVKSKPSITVSEKIDIINLFDGLKNVSIKVSYPGENTGRRANGYEGVAKTVNLANYTVIEFTSTGNSWDSGFTNGRYNMETVEKYIDKRGAKTEKREQSVLDVLKANAFIVTRPVKDDKGKTFYALTAKNKTVYSTTPWYLRGHGEAASSRAINTAFQEAGQALGLFTKYMLPNNAVDLSIEKLIANNFYDRFHFALFNNKSKALYMQDWLGVRKNEYAVYNCVNAASKLFSLSRIKSMHMSDMSTLYGEEISTNGFGPKLRTVFNDLNKGELKNINSWCPTDIVVYDSSLLNKLENDKEKFETLSDYTTWLNKQTDNGTLRLISLKLNTSSGFKKSYTHKSTAPALPKIKAKKWEINGGDIYLYVYLEENEKNKSKTEDNENFTGGNIIRLRFTTFNNDKGASIEADYYKGKEVHFDSDIEVSDFNQKENTQTVIGKALDGLKYFLRNQGYDDGKPEFVWPEGFSEIRKEHIISEYDKIATKTMPKRKFDKRILREGIMELYTSWLDKMRKYYMVAKTRNNNITAEDAINDFILYTIYAGKKEKYKEMDFFPKYYKIA